MRRALFLMIFLVLQPLPICTAEEIPQASSVQAYDDYVKIRFMPSRSGFMKKQPVTELISSTSTIVAKHDGSVMGTNAQIKHLYERAKAISEKGIVSNQQYFHVSFLRIEISHMGDTVSLEYVGPSEVEEFAGYEQAWRELYADAYRFLTTDIVLDDVKNDM